MAQLTVVYWRDIPAQVIVKQGRQVAKRQLTERFEKAIDRAAMRAKLRDTDCLLLDTLEELARELEVDVGLEQHATDFPQAFFDVGFGKNAAASKARKRGFEFLGQLVKHRPGKISGLWARFKLANWPRSFSLLNLGLQVTGLRGTTLRPETRDLRPDTYARLTPSCRGTR